MYHKLLQNAVESVQIGVEDYRSKDQRRLLSAVRNISSGVHLLFEENLDPFPPADSDEVLPKKNIELKLNSEGALYFFQKRAPNR